MKKILFTRHAKSSWFDALLSDHDRPLNNRGVKNTKLFSKIMKSEFIKVQEVYVSSAKRAQETAIGLKIDVNKIYTQKELYTFDALKLEYFIDSLSSDAEYIQLIGHNPAFIEFINSHSLISLDNLPTCGMVILEWEEANIWRDIKFEKARLLFFDVPKRNNF